jgi:hypothetical protein
MKPYHQKHHKENNMNTKLLLRCVSTFLFVAIVGSSLAGESQKKQAPTAPSIEGTYKLVSRKLPDGRMLSGQDVVGLLTFTKTYRNFNIAWKDTSGKFFSYSLVSTYKLTASEYSETILLSIMNDEIGGKGIAYTLTGQPATVPVKMRGGRLEFKMPFDPVSAVFEGGKFTGTNEAVFVDTWEKVK